MKPLLPAGLHKPCAGWIRCAFIGWDFNVWSILDNNPPMVHGMIAWICWLAAQWHCNLVPGFTVQTNCDRHSEFLFLSCCSYTSSGLSWAKVGWSLSTVTRLNDISQYMYIWFYITIVLGRCWLLGVPVVSIPGQFCVGWRSCSVKAHELYLLSIGLKLLGILN